MTDDPELPPTASMAETPSIFPQPQEEELARMQRLQSQPQLRPMTEAEEAEWLRPIRESIEQQPERDRAFMDKLFARNIWPFIR